MIQLKFIKAGLKKLVNENNVTLVISSHRLRDIEELIDVCIFIKSGRIIKVLEVTGDNYLSINCTDPIGLSNELTKEIYNLKFSITKNKLIIELFNEDSLNKILSIVMKLGVEWTKIEKRKSLEFEYDKYLGND